MSESVQLLNTILAAGSALLLLDAILLTILAFRNFRGIESAMPQIAKSASWLLLIVASAGTFMTLLYSEVFGFVPCGLCWAERIMLYPQVIVLGVALSFKDHKVFRYILALSLAGAAIALYHHIIQMGVSGLPCPSSGNGDCGKRLIFEFGFMTFPLMAFCLFAFQASVSYAALKWAALTK